MRWSIAIVFWLCFSVQGQTSSTNQPAKVITTSRAALELPRAEAEKHYQVRLKGTVTASDLKSTLFFVQDQTGGVYVYMQPPYPRVGAVVEVKGATDKGLFSPIVMADEVRVTGVGTLPPPAPMSVEQLSSGRHDSQWVEVEGIVLREFESWGHLVLTLGSGKSRMDVRVLNPDPPVMPNWVDARVKVKGVAGTSYNNRGQLTGFHLLTQTTNLVTIIDRPSSDPFSAELRVSSNLMSYSRAGASEHRMRLRGVVTFYWAGGDFYIRDDAGGVRIQSREQIPLAPGDLVEVVGFPSSGGYRPMLEEAVYRKIGEGSEPPPKSISVKEASSGENHSEVVAIEGMVVQSLEHYSGYSALVLTADQKSFRACFPNDWDIAKNENLAGARVRVTGVCAVDPSQTLPDNTFAIWLRRPSDCKVVEPPPIWRQRRMAIFLGGLGGTVLLGAIWIALMRVRVRQQTEVIRKRESALEERYKELFENANDVIYTHDLTGRITSVNNSGQALLGYTSAELLQMNVFDLIDPHDHHWIESQLAMKVEGVPRTSYEIRVRARNGQHLCLEVNSRLFYRDGAPAGVHGIAKDITARKQAEAALRMSERQLRASLEERERLGRDLHDGIIQSIYAAGMNLEDCVHLTKSDAPAVERRLRKVTTDLNGVIRDVRDFILGLEGHRLKGDEFKAALKSLTLTAGEKYAARVEILVDEKAAAELDSLQATELLQIAREALSNSIRHAKAQKVIFELRRRDNGVVFEIADDGIGFNPTSARENGFGLRNMAARAAQIKASFQILSQTGEGTRIVLDIRRHNPEESARENPLAYR